REFILALGGTAAWPLSLSAQQPRMPVIGLLNSASADTFADRLRAFRQGLKDTGHVEGDNVTIVYRWADGQSDRLPALADDLLRRQVALIAALGGAAAFAAKAATTTVPIVFNVDDDPVKLGLVGNLARPSGNLTGTNFLSAELTTKRLELLRELVPAAARVAVLANPTYPTGKSTVKDLAAVAPAMGLQLQVLNARTNHEINAAFATLARAPSDALFVAGDPFFTSRRFQLVNLTSRHAVPATFGTREFAEAGGLMSYGSNIADAWRQVGAYAGRILAGAKPADLPVVQASKFELVINAETARMLGIAIPHSLLALADEVIE
ncbi:MAG: ABC transporter substrate-binding protein, partial [Xanthobacteraceae bacterium]